MTAFVGSVQLASLPESAWIAANPELLTGQVAFSNDQFYPGSDQPKFKVGNGSALWSDLDYMPIGAIPPTWGTITGTLSNQTDLNTALTNNASAASAAAAAAAAAQATADNKTLEQVRLQDNTIDGDIKHTSGIGVINLSDTTPGYASATLGSGDGMVYANNAGSGIGTNTQTVGLFTDFSTETTVIKNSAGTVTLLSGGSLDIGGYQIKSLQAGTAATDAVNKSQLNAKQDIGANVNLYQLSHANGYFAFTDCCSAGDIGFSVQVSGSGTGGTASATPFTIQPAVGVTGFTMGTVATNRVAYACPSMVDTLFFGQGAAYYVSRHAINTLSDATNRYTCRIGFIDSVTAESTDGAFFRYIDTVNSGRWQCVTRANNVETATDSGVAAAAGTWVKFEVEVNAAGNSIAFKINGTTVQTHTTNIPTGSGRGTSYGNMVLRSVGTANFTSLLMDFAMCRQIFTASR
jgi:hypothetical protein